MNRESNTSEEQIGPQRDRAYKQLRQILIVRRASEGQRLNEETWSKQLGVNRAALREAFARLEAEGLITKGAQPGYFVPRLSPDDVSEILETRIVLECGAIDRICRRGYNDRESLSKIVGACDRLAELTEQGVYAEVAKADRLFHELLIEAARNKRLTVMYERAPLPIIAPDTVRGEEWLAQVHQTLKEHREIFEHLLAGDSAQAQAALRSHVKERFFILNQIE